MLSTYQAVLRGEVLEWLVDKPQNLASEDPVSVYVTILQEEVPVVVAERGLRMAAALERLAQMQSGFSAVDAIEWEREVRQERGLPGRDNDAN